MAIELPEFVQQFAEQIETAMPAALARIGGPPSLRAAMAYSLLAPGKRLRPVLVMLGCRAAGGDMNSAITAGIAVEAVHTYSLIHDDLPAMDDDDLRRGRPTCHKVYGEALAILAGDGLLTGAFQLLAEAYSRTVAALCVLELARGAGAAGMVGGQVEDLAWERNGGGIEQLQRIHENKTAALFRAALRIGAHVGFGDQEGDVQILGILDDFGREFGLAFQITDDLLDVQSNESTAGKRVGKDAARGKLTYPHLLGVPESERRGAAAVAAAQSAAAMLGAAGESLAALAGCLLGRRQ